MGELLKNQPRYHFASKPPIKILTVAAQRRKVPICMGGGFLCRHLSKGRKRAVGNKKVSQWKTVLEEDAENSYSISACGADIFPVDLPDTKK